MLASVAQAADLQTKPVLCGTPEEAFNSVTLMDQQLIYTATQITTVKSPEGFAPDPVLLPMSIFMNLETNTYSILEYHRDYNQYCLISFGKGGKFTNDK